MQTIVTNVLTNSNISAVAQHFQTAALIWDAFFNKQISAKKRDTALDALRAKL